MKSTLRSLFLVVLFMLICASSWQSEANHVAAADIYYEYLYRH